MQYILGVTTLACMEGDPRRGQAIKSLQRALELKPEYAEAKEALSEALAAAGE